MVVAASILLWLLLQTSWGFSDLKTGARTTRPGGDRLVLTRPYSAF